MKVTFRVNLGSRDAGSLGLDYQNCQAGASLDVPDDVAEKLAKAGLVEALPISGVDKEPEVAHAKPAEVKGVSESTEKATADLKSYRDKQKKSDDK